MVFSELFSFAHADKFDVFMASMYVFYDIGGTGK